MSGKHGTEYETRADIPRQPSGSIGDYRLGQAGSVSEETWNRRRHHHDCCGSRVPWRHKDSCPKLEGTLPRE